MDQYRTGPQQNDVDIEFIADYENGLSELTFNSKPLINTLTIIAGENLKAASHVVKIIETKIRLAESDRTLPVMYLLDSICKNIGGVYTTLFGQNIVQTFINAYSKVDLQTKNSLVHLYKTWNVLFSSETLHSIDYYLQNIINNNNNNFNNNNNKTSLPSSSIHVNPKFVQPTQTFNHNNNNNNVTGRVNVTTIDRVSEIMNNTNRTRVPNQVTNRGMGPPVVIPNQVPNSSNITGQGINNNKGITGQQQQQQQHNVFPMSNVPMGVPTPTSGSSSLALIHGNINELTHQANLIQQQPHLQNNFDLISLLHFQLQQQTTLIIQEVTSQLKLQQFTIQDQLQLANFLQKLQQCQQFPVNIVNIQSQLTLLQFISNLLQQHSNGIATTTTTPPSTTTTTTATNNTNMIVPPPPSSTFVNSSDIGNTNNVYNIPNNNPYETMGGHYPPQVTSNMAVPPKPKIYTPPMPIAPTIPMAPTVLPQTQQQGPPPLLHKDPFAPEILRTRIDSVVNGLYFSFPLQCKNCGLRFYDREKMDKHLDWHFLQNKKEKEKARKAMSRSWFLFAEDWINDTDQVEKAATPFFGEAFKNEEKEVKEEIHNVPADENQPTCGTCGERFEQFFDSEQDEWMYKDAISVNNIIHHRKCYLDSTSIPTVNNVNTNTDSINVKTEQTSSPTSSTTQTDQSDLVPVKREKPEGTEAQETEESDAKKPRVT